jgi:hypothetical protein
MERQNVTLSLPKSLLKKARTLAVLRNKSLSELLRDVLEKEIMDESGYQQARDRQVKLMEKGIDLGTYGKISKTRGELHERR